MLTNSFVKAQAVKPVVASPTMEEVKAMWLEGGLAVLAVVEMNFKESFEKLYKSRWSDFVLDDLMWGHTAREFRKAASRPKDWKMYLTHELVK